MNINKIHLAELQTKTVTFYFFVYKYMLQNCLFWIFPWRQQNIQRQYVKKY